MAMELQSRHHLLLAVESSSFLLIDSVAFLGNFLICLAVYRNPRLRIIPNYYIISLAIADFFTSTVCLPFSAGALMKGKWPFNHLICQLQGYFVFTFSIASLHTMALTACNRYIRVVKVRLYTKLYTSKLTMASILLIWSWALFCSALPLIVGISNFVFHPGTVICYKPPSFTPNSIVLTAVTLTINIPLPMGAVIILYHKVFRAIRRQRLRVSNEGGGPCTSAEDIKLARMLFVVALGFCICWGPVMIVECLRTITAWKLPRQIYLASTYLGAASSAVNVFIYGVMNKAFRVEFSKILHFKAN